MLRKVLKCDDDDALWATTSAVREIEEKVGPVRDALMVDLNDDSPRGTAVPLKNLLLHLPQYRENKKHTDTAQIRIDLPRFLGACGFKDDQCKINLFLDKNKGKRAARETTGMTTQVSGKGRNERAVTTTTATATTTTMAPARAAELKNKVLITLVQTDGLGLGAWAKGGRGTLPYSWEVTLPDLQIQVRGERTWMRRDE